MADIDRQRIRASAEAGKEFAMNADVLALLDENGELREQVARLTEERDGALSEVDEAATEQLRLLALLARTLEERDAWTAFLSAYVDYNHGSGISDRAWACFQGAHPDERPSGEHIAEVLASLPKPDDPNLSGCERTGMRGATEMHAE